MSGQITDLAVTYTSMHADPKFNMVGKKKIAGKAFVWFKRGETEPITDVKVVHSNAATKPGPEYIKIEGNINVNGTPEVCLYIRKGSKDASPIIAFKVMTSEDTSTPGFTRIPEVLNPEADTAPKEFLCFQTRADQAKLKQPDDWKEGDRLDILDNNTWRAAKVLKTRKEGEREELYITYDGWDPKWDEWVVKGPARCAAIGTKSRFTGSSRVAPPFSITENQEKFDEVCRRTAMVVDKKFSALSEEEFAFLTTGDHAKYIGNVLSAEITDPDTFIATQEFLGQALTIVSRMLADEEAFHPGFIESLVKLFGAHPECTRYYTYGYGTDPIVGKYANRLFHANNRVTSQYLVDNLNHFGEAGGFDHIRGLLAKIADKKYDAQAMIDNSAVPTASSFATVQSIVRALSKVTDVLLPAFAEKFIPELDIPKLLTNSIRNIKDAEVRNLTKEIFSSIGSDVTTILRGSYTADQISEIIEKIQLGLALRLLFSDVLSQSISGISQLHDVIHSINVALNPHYKVHSEAPAQRVWSGTGWTVAPDPVIPKAKYITPEFFVQWLEENKVVSRILGRSTHEQIIKRCPLILKFLAQQNALSVTAIEALWNAAVGKHEGLVRIVYDCLGDLAQDLSEEQVDALYAKIRLTPLSTYKDYDLNFLKLFTMNAVKATKGKDKWYGLPIFWDIVLDENYGSVPVAVANQSFTMLKELLTQHQFTEQRAVFLKKCLVGITEGKSVNQSLRLAQLILGAEPTTEESQILQLESEHKIIGLVLKDAKRYQEVAKKHLETAIKEAKAKEEEFKDEDLILDGRHSHNLQLASRLAFLNYVLANSSLVLEKEHIDLLWDVFVTRATLKSDTFKLVDWITTSALAAAGGGAAGARKAQRVLSEEATVYVFNLLSKPRADQASIKWYTCFQTIFVYQNYLGKSLLNGRADWLVVLNHDFIGLDALWNFAVQFPDEAIASAAGRFLVSLFLRLDFNLSGAEKKTVLGAFVTRCMTLLGDANKAVKAKQDVPQNVGVLARVSGLLTDFLERINSGEMMRRPLFNATERVKAYWKSQRGSKYAATVLEVNPDGTYQVKYDDGDFDEKAPESNIFTFTEDKKEQKTVEDLDVKFFPHKILSSDNNHFDLFFDLLGQGGDIGHKVWKMMEKNLPTNQTLADKVANLTAVTGDIDWKTLLPSDSVIKLLYTLQIVRANVGLSDPAPGTRTPAQTTPTAAAHASGTEVAAAGDSKAPMPIGVKNWCQMFLAKGGFKHIYDILVNTDQKEFMSGALPQECLALILTIIRHFLIVLTTPEESKAAHAAVDVDVMSARLLALVKATSDLSLATPKNEEEWNHARLHASLVSNGVTLLVYISLTKATLLEKLYAFPGWSDVLLKGLIKNNIALVRESFRLEFERFVLKFAIAQGQSDLAPSLHPRHVFLPLLLKFLGDLKAQTDADTCGDYFALTEFFLAESQPDDTGLDAKALSTNLLQLLTDHPILEKDVDVRDAMLVGLYGITARLIQRAPELKSLLGVKLVERVFDDLFEGPKPAIMNTASRNFVPPPKCKSVESRKRAFDLLAELGRGCSDNASILSRRLTELHMCSHSAPRKLTIKDWRFESTLREQKSRAGYAGLRNLGCICYMNAANQQLFMIPRLRHALLAVDDYKEENPQNSIIFQFQHILAHLQESEKQYVDPKPFCDIWTDETGKPINVGKQEDSGGYVNKLVDRFQTILKGTRHQHVFDDTFGGVLTHQLIGKTDCKHFKEREEDFITIQVEVKNKKTLKEGLEQFIEGEVLEGGNAYKCDMCNAKVDVVKRTVIKKLPPTLIVTLKRFDIDFNTFMPVKLDDRIEFPMDLDMRPYCAETLGVPEGMIYVTPNAPKPVEAKDGKDGKGGATPAAAPAEADDADKKGPSKTKIKHPADYYQYKLKGMVIHTGTASSGHYYSFIQERLISETGGTVDGNWFKFNDTTVTPFNPEDIPIECYGGTGKGAIGSFGGRANAYLLFYDRVRPDVDTTGTSTAVASAAPTKKLGFGQAVQAVTFSQKLKNKTEDARARVHVPPKIFNDIWEQNVTYWRDKAAFDPKYFDFLFEFVQSNFADQKSAAPTAAEFAALSSVSSANDVDNLTRLATRFYFMTLARALKKESLGQWTGLLKRMYQGNVASSVWLLDSFASKETGWTFDFFFACPEEDVRGAVADILCIALANVSPFEQATYDKDRKESKSVSASFIDTMLDFLTLTPEYDAFFDDYFKVLHMFVTLGPKEAKYMVQHPRHQFVGCMIDIYLGATSPNPFQDLPKDRMMRRVAMYHPRLKHFLKALSAAICSTGDANPLPPISNELLLSPIFLETFIAEGTTFEKGVAVGATIQHICLNNEGLSAKIIAYIGDSLRLFNYLQSRPLFRTIDYLCQMQDSIKETRVGGVLDMLLKLMDELKTYWKMTDLTIDFLIRMAKRIPAVFSWLHTHKERIEWMSAWLSANPKPPAADSKGTMKLERPRAAVGVGEKLRYHQKDLAYTQSTPYTHYNLPLAAKLISLENIAAGGVLDKDNCDDSDKELQDRKYAVRDAVDCLDTEDHWLPAKIIDVRPGEVLVKYDGFSDKWNAWVPTTDPRIAPHSRFSKWEPAPAPAPVPAAVRRV